MTTIPSARSAEQVQDELDDVLDLLNQLLQGYVGISTEDVALIVAPRDLVDRLLEVTCPPWLAQRRALLARVGVLRDGAWHPDPVPSQDNLPGLDD